MGSPAIYILTNNKHDCFYIGVTCNLTNRLKQLKVHVKDKEWTKLVYLEEFKTMMSAINREKELKRWESHWHASLVIKANPFWHDLSERCCGSNINN